MMKSKINLDEIISNNAYIYNNNLEVEDAKLAMIEFGKQLLELAYENAWSGYSNNGRDIITIVHKDSILDTINQVE